MVMEAEEYAPSQKPRKEKNNILVVLPMYEHNMNIFLIDLY